jgi:hypothetical protein
MPSRGRVRVLPPAMRERMWKPGQSGNPTGRGGLYHAMLRRAREATPELIDYLLEIARDGSEDARNRIVAISILLERGWGKVKEEYDPAAEQAPMQVDLSRLTPEQRHAIAEALALLRSVRVEPQVEASVESVEPG